MNPSRRVFVDTSGWYALTDRSDQNHADAQRQFRHATGQGWPIVTTNHVVGESFTLLQRRTGPRAARQFLERMRNSSIVARTFVPEAWEEEAERLLAQYHDQRFSYVDATSFATMRHLGIQKALAFDNDFVIAGFVLLGDS
jgi:predicted nucleic acid-binding protein